MFNRFLDFINPSRFKTAEKNFIGKDNLFSLTLPDNWIYSMTKNSYYYFANEELNGGFEISLIWNIPINKEIKHTIQYANFLLESKFNEADYEICDISGRESLKLKYRLEGSNMNFMSWFLKTDQLLLQIRSMIYEEQPGNIQEKWIFEIEQIIKSLKIDFDKFNR